MQRSTLAMLSGIGFLLLSVTAQAELIRITPEGVAVDEQVITDPVPIYADGFRLTYHGGGSQSILDPLFIIFATPDGVTPGITPSGVSNPGTLTATTELGGTNMYGGSWNTTTGFAGTYNATTSKDATGGNISVYEYIGFDPAGSDSQNYPNWNGTSGIDSWDLWVYTVTFDPDLSKGDWMEFSTTNLALGSYVVGYGCTGLDSSSSNCTNNAAAESTPFTFAGYVVPEPASLALIGIGLIGLGFNQRRRRHS